jgi:hypothetical protein
MAEPYQLFPDLPADDYAALKADIARHGVMVPVEYDDEGNILDGHHRVRAFMELAYEGVALDDYPRVIREGLSEKQKRSHVRRLNILRRHLTREQIRDLIRDQLQDTPSYSDNRIAKSLGVHNETVGTARRQMIEDGSLTDSVSDREGADGRVINTANIGRAPSPRRAPDPDLADDYVEDVNREPEPAPEAWADEPAAHVDGDMSTRPFVMPEPEQESAEERAYYALTRQRLVVRLDPSAVADVSVEPADALAGFEEFERWLASFMTALRSRVASPVRRVK